MTRNYEPNLDWRADQRTHRFRKSVYGAFPYPNLARDVTRTLCDIGATLGKNKEPVTSNRATLGMNQFDAVTASRIDVGHARS